MFPQLARFTDLGLLLMRLMTGVVFVASGSSHLKDPGARGKSIGMGKGVTIFLGIVEVAGGLGVAFGVMTTRRDRTHSHHAGRHPEKRAGITTFFLRS